MKRPAFRGFTAAGVLVLAVAAGAAGGAVAYSAAQGNPAPSVPAVTALHQVADEATPSPTPSAAAPVVDEKPAPAVEVVHPASTKVVAPAPAVEGESASAAADRATAEADRASNAADRAEKAEQKPAGEPAPEPKVVATPDAPAPVVKEEDPVAKPEPAPVKPSAVVVDRPCTFMYSDDAELARMKKDHATYGAKVGDKGEMGGNGKGYPCTSVTYQPMSGGAADGPPVVTGH